MYHSIIVGAGPSGIQAAAVLAFDGLKVLLLDSGNLGGQILNSPLIENVAGHTALVPHEWAAESERQLLGMGVQIKTMTPVQEVWTDRGAFAVYTESGEYVGRTVILAHGCSSRPLPVPGANLPRVRYALDPQRDRAGGRRIIVVGGANSAGTVAMHLSRCGNEVVLLHRGNANISHGIMKRWENVETYQRQITNIREHNATLSVRTDNGVFADIDEVFVMAGRLPNSVFADGLVETDENGFVFAETNGVATTHPGVFACGNCVRNSVRTMGASIGSGTNAANAVWQYMKGR